jgi:16S rRNA (cytidine1402-2'-O)-methyltransferase
LADSPLREAVDAVTAKFGLKRKDVYTAALALRPEP